MITSVFRQKWGIRLALFVFLVAIWFGLQAYRRFFVQEPTVLRVPPAPVSAPSLEETRATWRQNVKRIVAMYDQDKQAERAREALLALTVAREDQEAHLRLVLALNALIEGASGADKKWQTAQALFEKQ